MSELSESDRMHLDAWRDSGDGYSIKSMRMLRCLWCSYIAFGVTDDDALARYRREHEEPILERAADEIVRRNAVDAW